MKGDFRQYWRSRAYWKHLLRKYAEVLRFAGLLVLMLLLGTGGFALAYSLREPETFTIERLVTVESVVNGEVVTTVSRQVLTVTEPPQTETNMVTVVRDGETITIPGKDILRTDTITGPTVTDVSTQFSTRTRTQTERETETNTETQTNTQTETQTTDRTTTVTEPRDVPGPTQTETQTQTDTQTQTETETGPTTTVTETETETQTQTVTETETETETVTEPKPPDKP